MIRFTIQINDQLNQWLIEQAALNYRSKNGQIEHLLELARRMSVKNKVDDNTRYRIGAPGLCHNGTHLFASSQLATNDFCNCGMYVYGELSG